MAEEFKEGLVIRIKKEIFRMNSEEIDSTMFRDDWKIKIFNLIMEPEAYLSKECNRTEIRNLASKYERIFIYGAGKVGKLQVEVKIDSAYEEPKVIVLTSSMTEEVNRLVKKLSEDFPKMLAGIRNDRCELLEQTEIIRIYAASGKVYAVTAKGEYVLRRRLYELEEQLAGSSFVRISNSEMINLKKVEHFDLSFTGTIYVKLSNQTSAYVSRRYVSKIKTMLGI